MTQELVEDEIMNDEDEKRKTISLKAIKNEQEKEESYDVRGIKNNIKRSDFPVIERTDNYRY